MFRDTIQGLGHDVAVPKFGTKNWMKIAGKAKEIVKRERPDAVHVFNRKASYLSKVFTNFGKKSFRSIDTKISSRM